jgi:hypothetical protein
MRGCILLSGLQRNAEPFINNQLNIINKFNLDVFIYTSDDNYLRFCERSSKGTQIVDYIKNIPFNTTINDLKERYPSAKSVFIDHNNECFNNFLLERKIKKNRNHTIHMLSSYFKVTECIKLMENYEKENNFKYDYVLRARLDFYITKSFINLDIFTSKDHVILPFSKYEKTIDDSGILMPRDCATYLKDFIEQIINFNDENDYIFIEGELKNYLKMKYNVVLNTNFTYRLGLSPLNEVPYLTNIQRLKLNSIEYKRFLVK